MEEAERDEEMTKKRAMAWVKALRSGKYEQGKGFLWNDYKYCCLGVLANISKVLHDETKTNLLGIEKECGIKNAVGIPTEGTIIISDWYQSLAVANDDGVSFDKIADWIERNYKLL